jgi:hypothetical protein
MLAAGFKNLTGLDVFSERTTKRLASGRVSLTA